MKWDGEALKRARKSLDSGRGLSRDAFARLIVPGVVRETIMRWEAGDTEPTATRLASIMAVTGRPFSYFFRMRGRGD